MKDVERQISHLVQTQFPIFFQEEGDRFVKFARAYYEWLEQENNTLNVSRGLLETKDVDQTVELFYTHFRKKYLVDLPITDPSKLPILVKNASNIYKSKGTQQGVSLMLRLLYGVDSEVYLPATDLWKLSDGVWMVPSYLELSRSSRTKNFLAKEIIGLTSGARAFAESFVTRKINGRYIDVLYISNVVQNFQYGEKIALLDDQTDLNSPVVLGSLSKVSIINGGQDFEIGDVLDIVSSTGKQGKAIVTEISSETGTVRFNINNGGFGYTLNANVVVSDKTLFVSNLVNSNTDLDIGLDYTLFEDVQQTLKTIRYDTSNSQTIDAGANLYSYHVNGDVKGVSVIISSEVTNTVFGTLILSPVIDDFDPGDDIGTLGNTFTATVNAVINSTATGTVIRTKQSNTSSSNLIVGIYGSVNEFKSTPYAPLVGLLSNTYSQVQIVGSGEGATFRVGLLSNEEDIIVNTDRVGANNVGFVPYNTILLDGTGSNSTGYGFPKFSSANVNTLLLDALTFENATIGTIEEITGIDRGQDYTTDPLVTVKEELIFPLERRDYELELANTVGLFVNGEIVEQTFAIPLSALTVTSLTGNTSLDIGEVITQANSTSSNAAYGFVYAFGSTGGSITSISVQLANGSGSFVASGTYPVTTLTSNTSSTVTNVAAITVSTSARGIVETYNSATKKMLVSRISVANNFIANSIILGTSRGATATLKHVKYLTNEKNEQDILNIVGINADIAATVQVSNNTVTNVEIVDSGYGYEPDQVLTMSKPDHPHVVTAQSNLINQGISFGRYESTKGFLDSDKYVHDNDFYQEFSYQVQSGLSFETYKDVLKKVMHVAGTKMFGKVNLESQINLPISLSNVEKTVILFLPYSETGYTGNTSTILNVGDKIYQANSVVGEVVDGLKSQFDIHIANRCPLQSSDVYYPDKAAASIVGHVFNSNVAYGLDYYSYMVVGQLTGLLPDNTYLTVVEPSETGFIEYTTWAFNGINSVTVKLTSDLDLSANIEFNGIQSPITKATLVN
jgi:hypothetical protein